MIRALIALAIASTVACAAPTSPQDAPIALRYEGSPIGREALASAIVGWNTACGERFTLGDTGYLVREVPSIPSDGDIRLADRGPDRLDVMATLPIMAHAVLAQELGKMIGAPTDPRGSGIMAADHFTDTIPNSYDCPIDG